MPLEAASGHGHGAVPFTTADGMTPLYLSTMAGMSTCLGAAIVFCHPKQSANDPRRIVSPAMMAFSLALAGSVMLTVSIISIGPECLHEPSHEQDRGEGTRYIPLFSWLFAQRLLSFGLGCTFYGLLRMLFSDPDDIEAELLATMTRDDQWLDRKEVGEEGHPLAAEREDPFDASEKETSVRKRKASPTDSEFELSLNGNRRNRRSDPGRSVSSLSFGSWASGHDLASREQRRAWRIAMLLFVSLLAHNLPEGMAVVASALEDDKLGITVTLGIALHNIPEGIAVAVPCLAARPDSPWISFVLASVSGLAEPLGALVTLGLIRHFGVQSDLEDSGTGSMLTLENCLSLVAGIMMTVAVVELYPEANRHKQSFWMWVGTFFGAFVMILTEIFI